VDGKKGRLGGERRREAEVSRGEEGGEREKVRAEREGENWSSI
jgi:hypothetical protein